MLTERELEEVGQGLLDTKLAVDAGYHICAEMGIVKVRSTNHSPDKHPIFKRLCAADLSQGLRPAQWEKLKKWNYIEIQKQIDAETARKKEEFGNAKPAGD